MVLKEAGLDKCALLLFKRIVWHWFGIALITDLARSRAELNELFAELKL